MNSNRRVHPCVCGFSCDTAKLMKGHRTTCVAWQTRPDPLGMMIERRRVTHVEKRRSNPPKIERCPMCHRRSDHHMADCPDSSGDAARRGLLEKHGIDPFKFEIILRALAKRYANRYN